MIERIPRRRRYFIWMAFGTGCARPMASLDCGVCHSIALDLFAADLSFSQAATTAHRHDFRGGASSASHRDPISDEDFRQRCLAPGIIAEGVYATIPKRRICWRWSNTLPVFSCLQKGDRREFPIHRARNGPHRDLGYSTSSPPPILSSLGRQSPIPPETS